MTTSQKYNVANGHHVVEAFPLYLNVIQSDFCELWKQ